MRRIPLILLGCVLLVSTAFSQTQPLVVHEWGTFTSLQDGSGRALGAINQDTEPLPEFVKDLLSGGPFGKGIPVSQSITMRLETPVVYFHPAKGSAPMTVSFSAEFHGGQLTQFYPTAATNVEPNKIPTISADSLGRLEWKDITIGKPAPGPATKSPVWLAPRRVDAADITNSVGEAERYLFYRGVGQIDSPLNVTRIHDHLRITSPTSMPIDTIWYFDLRADGKCAFRRLDTANQDKPGVITEATLAETDYREDALTDLQADMKKSLMSAGLFDDEAQAMLDTWRESYFKSAGTRVFFMVPRAWTDRVLPIKISVPAKIERVMIGRVDLVTPRHEELARTYLLSKDKSSPQAQQLYKELGRFAAAIIADETRRQQQGPQTPVSMR
jgi:hypothetical protein